MIKNTTLFLALLLSIASCQEDESDCGPTACTFDFRSVSVRIVDRFGNPVDLDRTEVSDQLGTTLTSVSVSTFPQSNNGYYVIADDGHKNELRFDLNLLLFKGWKDGKKVVQQEFAISRDCCHVGKLDGPDQIIID